MGTRDAHTHTHTLWERTRIYIFSVNFLFFQRESERKKEMNIGLLSGAAGCFFVVVIFVFVVRFPFVFSFVTSKMFENEKSETKKKINNLIFIWNDGEMKARTHARSFVINCVILLRSWRKIHISLFFWYDLVWFNQPKEEKEEEKKSNHKREKMKCTFRVYFDFFFLRHFCFGCLMWASFNFRLLTIKWHFYRFKGELTHVRCTRTHTAILLITGE